VAVAAAALAALEPLLRLAEPVQRFVRLRAAVARSIRRRAPHRVRRLLELPDRVVDVAALLLARELLQLPRRLLELFGELPLRVRAVTAARRRLSGLQRAALPLDLLLLASGELLQLLDHLVDLLIALLHLGALLHLVLVRELVELELEQVREVLGH